MRRSYRLLALALLASSGSAIAGTERLDTGYDHGAGGYYSTGSDNYWIKIASYEPPAASAPVAPANIIHGASPVAGPTTAPDFSATGVKFLAPNPSGASSPGTSGSNKGYSLYRKCFCLLSTQDASLSFRLRGDDRVMAWLNTITNILAGPASVWSASDSSLQSKPTNVDMFQEGRNCVYVLVEDYWGTTGFSLHGQVTAPGLMPMMAQGPDASFGPCRCPGPPGFEAPPAPGAPPEPSLKVDGASKVSGLEPRSARGEEMLSSRHVEVPPAGSARPRR